MFFVISKILGYLLTPLLWIIVLIVLALFQREHRKTKRYLSIALGLSLFFSNNFLADEFMRMWELPVVREAQLAPVYDAGIILGGGMIQQDSQTGRLIFRSNTDRFLQAMDLYKKGRIKKMVISGGAGHLLYRNMLEASLLKKYLVGIGIPEQDILVDSLSDNTLQNAVNTAKILKEHIPGKNLLLITSSSHMRRAMACFTKQGMHCTPYPTNKMTGRRVYSFQHLFVPEIRSILFYDTLIHECLGYVVYKVIGYI